MVHDPHQAAIDGALAYFGAHRDRYGVTADAIHAFVHEPNLAHAEALTDTYFHHHQEGDLEGLRRLASVYADKRLVRSVVDSILNDETALKKIAAQSYPHPIGFDKLVLNHHRPSKPGDAAEHKLRLHIYWRTPQEIQAEREHLHKFEMASAIISGELTNHESQVTAFDNQTGLVADMEQHTHHPADLSERTAYAYSGYRRDAEGVLHKSYLGPMLVRDIGHDTFYTGQAYAQPLNSAHYVETNAETGHTNGDVCSTMYIHGPNLTDAAGRAMPILFEDERLPNDDTIIATIPPMTPEYLRERLTQYRALLTQSIEYYDWLYDPKYGRNLSTGMIAGYLLSETLQNPETVMLWTHRNHECLRVLEQASTTLHQLVRGEMSLDDIPDRDRTKRYYQQLLLKAQQDPDGPEVWLQESGDLKKEMWRYLGALIGDHARNSDTRVLKPSWELAPNLKGGAHYGHISAMLEAGYEASHMLSEHFRQNDIATEIKPGTRDITSTLDREVDEKIRSILLQHYPEYLYHSEDGDHEGASIAEGTKRFLVDSLDGTRNYLAGHDKYAVSIACQTFQNGEWGTTDAIVAEPANGRIYWAEKGSGAFCIDHEGGRESKLILKAPGYENPPTAKEVMQGKIIDASILGLGKAKYDFQERMNKLGATDHNTGCAALMLCMTAGHGNHGAAITAEPHDVAAGMLIAKEAGVQVDQHRFTRQLETGPREFTAYIAAQEPPMLNILKRGIQQSLEATKTQMRGGSPT